MKTLTALLLGTLTLASADAYAQTRQEIPINYQPRNELTLSLPERIVNHFSGDPLMTQEDYPTSWGDLYGTALLSVDRARLWHFLKDEKKTEYFLSRAQEQTQTLNTDLSQRLGTIRTGINSRSSAQTGTDLEKIGSELYELTIAAGQDTAAIVYTIMHSPKKMAENTQ